MENKAKTCLQMQDGIRLEQCCSSLIYSHQRCGYSDSPFARIHYFYTAGPGTGLEGLVALCDHTLTLRKRHFIVIEKHIEDVKQEDTDVPDLLESIMRPTDPAKEELRRILFKEIQKRPKTIKIRVSTFWMSGKSTDSRQRPTQPSRLVSCKPMTAFQTPKKQNCRF